MLNRNNVDFKIKKGVKRNENLRRKINSIKFF